MACASRDGNAYAASVANCFHLCMGETGVILGDYGGGVWNMAPMLSLNMGGLGFCTPPEMKLYQFKSQY